MFKTYQSLLVGQTLSPAQQTYLLQGLTLLLSLLGPRVFDAVGTFKGLHDMMTPLLPYEHLRSLLSNLLAVYLQDNPKYRAIVSSLLMNQITLCHA